MPITNVRYCSSLVAALRLRAVFLSAAVVATAVGRPAVAQGPIPSIADKTAGLQRIDGFLPMYLDTKNDKVWLEIARFGEDILYISSLPTGAGGTVDRGEMGGGTVIRFERAGTKILAVTPDFRHVTSSSDPGVRQAIRESFSYSIPFGFPVAAETNGTVLIDATAFVFRDANGAAGRLGGPIDLGRSTLYLPRTKGFPKNTEIEVVVTFGSGTTLRQHHSFISLPPLDATGYRLRPDDPRAGFFGMAVVDYSVPFDQPIQRTYISRHRLAKKDPNAAVSDPVEPIVYYIDRGAPEPIRSALKEGAEWWNQAFEAAGYRNAFRVEFLPEDADPMDIRYNLVQWVIRNTRGWSYGNSIDDPRTGQILKGIVTLDALRIRQDYLLAQGLLSPFSKGDEDPEAAKTMALARIRQLAAHEVGHTLGLAHNYIASTQGRASVMDYPPPRVKLTAQGEIDLSDAYAVGIGEWDKVAITYGYQDFPAGTDEKAALDAILTKARQRNLTYLGDGDARPTGSAHPEVHLWDNGTDAVAELDHAMKVRRAALGKIGERSIRTGEPLAAIEYVFMPVYLHHRYQVEAAIKVIGGQYYEYALRGEKVEPLRAVPAKEQLAALDAVLKTLSPAELAISKAILEKLPPDPGVPWPKEGFDKNTSPVFDAIGPAAAAADMVVSVLLDRNRAARLIQQNALDPTQPSLGAVIDRLISAVFDAKTKTRYEAEINRGIERVVVDRLMGLAFNAPMSQVRAIATAKLEALGSRPFPKAVTEEERAARRLIAADIRRFLERPYDPAKVPPAPRVPPGSPIGQGEAYWEY